MEGGEEGSQEPQLVVADKEVVKRKKNMEGEEKEVVKRSKYMQGEEGSQLADKDIELVRAFETLIAESEQHLIEIESLRTDLLKECKKKDELVLGRPISTLRLDIQKAFW